MKCPKCGGETPQNSKFCSYCGSELPQPQKVENHSTVNNITYNINYADDLHYVDSNAKKNKNSNTVIVTGRQKNKWISFFLCLFTIFGHKFYEGKVGMGFIYLFTCGLFGIGWIFDLISLLCKSNPYYV
ncbi:MAG: NINE protein [Oscillospiraceae bacterium]